MINCGSPLLGGPDRAVTAAGMPEEPSTCRGMIIGDGTRDRK
jgi:hypothetical protein